MKNPTQKESALNPYEMALLRAWVKSRKSEKSWGSFIDNLSQICDGFATDISPPKNSTTPPYKGKRFAA